MSAKFEVHSRRNEELDVEKKPVTKKTFLKKMNANLKIKPV